MQQKNHANPSLSQPDHKHSLENSRLIQLTRNFDATPERVWECLTTENLVKQWWGPKHYTCPFASIDFRIGGKYLLAMESNDGNVMWGTGVFENIIDQKLIVYADHFANEKGQVISPEEAGFDAQWKDDMFVTLELEPMNENLDGARGGAPTTQFLLSHQGIPTAQHDDCTKGWNESLDKLQSLVERKMQ